MKNSTTLIILVLIFTIFLSCSDDSSTEPNNEAPTCSISSPVDNFTLNKGDSIIITLEAQDDNSISEINLYLDNSVVNTKADSTYSYIIHTDGINTGKHVIKAEVIDNEGLKSLDSVSVNIEIYISLQDQALENIVRTKIDKLDGQLYSSDVDSITVLRAVDKDIISLVGLEYFTSLYDLNLDQNDISDISPISSLSSLHKLYLQGNPLSEISPLSNLVSLQILDLGWCYISDITSLSNLTSLTSLNLFMTINITDISPLSGLTNLTSLELYENKITDLAPLAGLVNLVILDLGYNEIIDISALSNLTMIEELNLGENFRINDISALSGMSNMRELFLHLNQIVDISALSGMTELRRITLHYNGVSDISPLSNSTLLEDLDIPDNNVQDISILSNLSNLNKIDLKGNDVFDIYPLVENLDFANGDEVDFSDNPLNTTSIDTHIPELQARGVLVTFGK
jgi:Leucine-rich repeat (LRR) protein